MLATCPTFALIFAGVAAAYAANLEDYAASLIQTHVENRTSGAVIAASLPAEPAVIPVPAQPTLQKLHNSVILVVIFVPLLVLPICVAGSYALFTLETPVQARAHSLRAQATDLRERAAALCSEASQVLTQPGAPLPRVSRTTIQPVGSAVSWTKRVLLQVGPILPLILLSTLSLSTLEANQGWIRLNFFAHRYASATDKVHCELTPSEYYCRSALEDKAGASVILSFVPPVVHVLLAPPLGASSDSRGRRSLLVVCQLLSTIPVLATALFVYFRVSLYLAFVLSPLAELPVEALCLAWVTDRITSQADIAGAFGLLVAAKYAAFLAGWILGNVLSVRVASATSLAACVLATAYVMIFLPESLPAKKRKHLERPLTMPGVGLRVFGRNGTSLRLALMMAIALFCDKGFGEVSRESTAGSSNWSGQVGSVPQLLDQVSSILWVCSLGALAHILGFTGTVAFARWSAILFVVASTFTAERWHAVVVHALFAGPVMLTFPTLAAMCSALVTPNEQGLMQGCVGAVASIAECLGPYIFFLLFDTGKSISRGPLSVSPMVILAVAGSVATLLLLGSLRLHQVSQAQKLQSAVQPDAPAMPS